MGRSLLRLSQNNAKPNQDGERSAQARHRSRTLRPSTQAPLLRFNMLPLAFAHFGKLVLFCGGYVFMYTYMYMYMYTFM